MNRATLIKDRETKKEEFEANQNKQKALNEALKKRNEQLRQVHQTRLEIVK